MLIYHLGNSEINKRFERKKTFQFQNQDEIEKSEIYSWKMYVNEMTHVVSFPMMKENLKKSEHDLSSFRSVFIV